MHLERLQVEEGFLSGLDVKFTPGLNVIIGARGTGKTSLIELIRFCLDVNSTTSDATKRSREHALSILGAGQVTAALLTGEQRTLVSRTASDSPQSTSSFPKPIVFSQTEIETVGLESSGRLRLIDGFISNQNSDEAEEKQIVSTVASLTTEVVELKRELDDLQVHLRDIPLLEAELNAVLVQETKVASSSLILQQKTESLKKVAEAISLQAVSESNLMRAQADIYNWYVKIKEAQDFVFTGGDGINGILTQHHKVLESTRQNLKSAHDSISNVWHQLEAEKKSINAQKLISESQARDARQELEVLQSGAGLVMRKGQELRERKAQLDSLSNIYKSKLSAHARLLERRNDAFDRLDGIRSQRFSVREQIVQSLNKALSPNIRISIVRNGQPSKYTALISELLKGSGVKYNDIAPQISNAISPRLLLESVENFDANLVSESIGINIERAARILTHLKQTDLGMLATIDLEDEIGMQLLDGADYKDISALSTGQRCTVILPIVLSHRDRIVIVDQPEDHIDNAFITSTLIKAIVSRNPNSQIIFSTHNPNIPVLGAADNVIHLGSDGKRGFVLDKGSLNDSTVVKAISTVMEGGAEAFLRRASFYSQSSL
ncbi:ABC-type lipoprotein export system ATPase subunit [Rheinheimera pacifica]|uniref:AAA family ATPase n=1 Tax=Rheinheimera pacifica TaxID=173990 RepID=UPI00216A1FE7|nr:AAA family ATPase [Rheinheimera pacifica]MCS4309712.1 ABC-type lipoprotein export system ATPase subunit [Rheinheimera pacifica]